MCGILFTRSPVRNVNPLEAHVDLISRRGPDATNTHTVITGPSNTTLPSWTLTFTSSLLSLRGEEPTAQPLLDLPTGSALCWNGEAWRISGSALEPGINDTTKVFELLLQDPEKVDQALGAIEGEFALVFYDAARGKVWYGRDWAGRRSLVKRTGEDGGMQIASVGDRAGEWEEVDAGGVWCLDIDTGEEQWINAVREGPRAGRPLWDIPPINREVGETPLTSASPEIATLHQVLTEAVELRVRAVPAPPGADSPVRIAVLFSGGVDCTTLTRLAHEHLPASTPIDLLNVAFENPRVLAARKKDGSTPSDPYALCPDRQTGLSSYRELCEVCPGRELRFVAINIPYSEVLEHRDTVISLMSPQDTEMDLSIALAFYFAARGTGLLYTSPDVEPTPYTTPARILLSGLGADELFGGYTRHTRAYERGGYPALVDELELDFRRLGKRNLGRDDRVVSTWAKEMRYPFLDERVVSWAMNAQVTRKCPFGQQDTEGLEKPKLALRLLAKKLGMVKAAAESKRAVQFGARSAKMTLESTRMKGTDGLSGGKRGEE